MYCKSCGSKIEEGDRFCQNCGKQVQDSTAASFLQNLRSYITTAMERRGLDQRQQLATAMAACAAFLFIVCLKGTLVTWITAISGIMLFVFCLHKKNFDSMELTLAMTCFAARFLVIDIENISNTGIVHYSFFTVIMRLVIYGIVIIDWLAVTGRFEKKEFAYGLVFLLSGLAILYGLVRFLMAIPNGLRSCMFYLGWTGFFGCYAILLSREWGIDEAIKPIREILASKISDLSAKTSSVGRMYREYRDTEAATQDKEANLRNQRDSGQGGKR